MTRQLSSPPGLRVIHVIDSLGAGGAERSIAELLPFFLEAGIEPMMVCLAHREHGVEEEVVRLCGVRWLPPGPGLRTLFALRSIVKEVSPHLIHTTLFDSDILGRLSAWGTGIPVLTSLVNTTYDPVRLHDPNISRVGLWAARTVDGWTARHLTTHFHAITSAVKAAAVRDLGLPPDRISVIARGRARDRLGSAGPGRRAAARRRLGLSDGDEVVVSVGRREYQKGQRYLLEAVAILVRQHPRLKLLVAGREGRASRELDIMVANLELGEHVRFLGHRDDIPDILAASDVFAFPSVYEGLGGAVIEAMGLGLPIVASDLPALREVVEDGRNAVLVPPGSASQLAAALRRLLTNGEQALVFGERSVQIFEERFTLGNSARKMVELYQRVASRRRTSVTQEMRAKRQ